MGKNVTDAGGAVVEILETKFLGVASKSDLDAWVNTFQIPVTSVIDAPGQKLATYHALGVRETCFVVDLSTMKIVDKFNGSLAGFGDSSITQAMSEVLTLLGNKGG